MAGAMAASEDGARVAAVSMAAVASVVVAEVLAEAELSAVAEADSEAVVADSEEAVRSAVVMAPSSAEALSEVAADFAVEASSAATASPSASASRRGTGAILSGMAILITVTRIMAAPTMPPTHRTIPTIPTAIHTPTFPVPRHRGVPRPRPSPIADPVRRLRVPSRHRPIDRAIRLPRTTLTSPMASGTTSARELPRPEIADRPC
jgi:hypothetical protein